MYRMNQETIFHLESISHKIKAIANMALAIEEAMIHSPLADSNFELSVSFLGSSLSDLSKEIDHLIEAEEVIE